MTRAAHGPQLKKDAILPMPLVTCPCRGDPECGLGLAIADPGRSRHSWPRAVGIGGGSDRNLAMTRRRLRTRSAQPWCRSRRYRCGTMRTAKRRFRPRPPWAASTRTLHMVLLGTAALAHGDAVAAKRAFEVSWNSRWPQRAIFARGIIPMPEAFSAAVESSLRGGGPTTPSAWWRAARWSHCWRAPILRSRRVNPSRPSVMRTIHWQSPCDPWVSAGPRRRRVPRRAWLLVTVRTNIRPACSGRHMGSATDRTGPLQDVRRRLRICGGCDASIAGNNDFDAGWTEGAALSTEEVIVYAQRGRGAAQTTLQRMELAHPGRTRRDTSGQ